MDRLWAWARPSTVREVLADLQRDRSVAYTTVMTVMDNLHRKGILDRRADVRAYRYVPVRSRAEHTADLIASVPRPYADHRGFVVSTHLATHLALADHSESTLADSLHTVGQGHAEHPDVLFTCQALEAMSRDHVNRLAAVVRRSGATRAGRRVARGAGAPARHRDRRDPDRSGRAAARPAGPAPAGDAGPDDLDGHRPRRPGVARRRALCPGQAGHDGHGPADLVVDHPDEAGCSAGPDRQPLTVGRLEAAGHRRPSH